jgi:CheY-like chemotaxis protein
VADEHILVVEDDPGVRAALADALTLEGFEVMCVENGEVAFRHLKQGARPCVILLDLMMPVMDGWTFQRTLLADPRLADIPIVIMTAVGVTRAASLPVGSVLHKPLRMDTVVEVVQGHCRHHEA